MEDAGRGRKDSRVVLEVKRVSGAQRFEGEIAGEVRPVRGGGIVIGLAAGADGVSDGVELYEKAILDVGGRRKALLRG